MNTKNTLKNFILILCKPFKALKEEYQSKIAISHPVYFTEEEYKKFCKIAKENEKFDKGEIWLY